MAKTIEIDGKEILVRPPKYPSTEVKEVLGGRWDKGKNAWRLQPTALNMLTIEDWYGREFFAGAPWVIRNLVMHDWGFTGWNDLASDNGIHSQYYQRAMKHNHWEELYDFQKEAVEYMVCNPHRGCILALSPGLGKSPTSIVAADILEASKILVVAPLTLARNWMAMWDEWSSLYRSWSRATAGEKDPKTECVITNFETLFEPVFIDEDGEEWEYPPKRVEGIAVSEIRGAAAQKKWIMDGPKKKHPRTGKMVPVRQRKVEPRWSYFKNEWDIIIIDESVLLKNRKAVKVDVLQKMAQYAHQVWLLSGSPTSKFRSDLFPQVKTIMPRGFASYWRFADFFCTVDRNQWGWSVVGDRPDHDPQRYLKDFMFVRNQKDVLEELPDYIYDPIEVDLLPAQEKAFREMVEDWSTQLAGKRIDADNRLAQSTRLQQITSNMINLPGGKRASAKEDLLYTLLEQDDIEFPLLVWCWFVPTAQSVYDMVYDSFQDLEVDMVVGEMKSADKDEAIDAYRSGDLDVLVLQMGVGRFGHNLQNTRTVFYHDRSFDTDAYIQSLRRVKRIGLKHRPRLIVPRSKHSSDPIVELNLAGKMQSISKVANHDLRELLRSLGSGMVPWSLKYPDIVDGEQI